MVQLYTLLSIYLLAGVTSAATKCTAGSHSAAVQPVSRSSGHAGTILPSTAQHATLKTSVSKSSPKTSKKASLGSSKTAIVKTLTALASGSTARSLSSSRRSTYTRPSTCAPLPPVSYSTLSLATSVTTVYSGASTSVVTFTAYQQATITVTTDSTVFTRSAPTTSTTTTLFMTTYTSVPAPTTVTVATPPGFTPVDCLPTRQYAGVVTVYGTTSTVTADVSTQVVTVTPSTVVGTLAETVYSATVTSTIAESTLYTSFVSTLTSTKSSATRTRYDACATNNIVAENPAVGLFYLQRQLPGTSQRRVPAVDAEDCCSQCQADSNCTGSGYYLALRQEELPECYLFIKQSASTCDPTFQGQVVFGNGVNGITRPLFISNSGCGQFGIAG